MKNSTFDLLSTVEYGGCSAKLSPKELSALLCDIPLLKNSNVLVDIESHDDAGVYKINDEMALVVTTDFFPPICSDPYQFGQIAAANSLSDIYAMGGKPLLALNITMFPSKDAPLEALKEILLGGQNKIDESGAFTMGGHTIDDAVPKYGLAVVGTVHPQKVITNTGVKAGQKLILTKPLGTAVVIAARRLELCSDATYKKAIEQMMLLNDLSGDLMQKYGVTGATDITGFGLMGHAMKMAQASGVTITLSVKDFPLLPEVENLLAMGCVPGSTFRNIDYCKEATLIDEACRPIDKLICADAQTSGGIFMAVDADKVDDILRELHASGTHPQAAVVGEATVADGDYALILR